MTCPIGCVGSSNVLFFTIANLEFYGSYDL